MYIYICVYIWIGRNGGDLADYVRRLLAVPNAPSGGDCQGGDLEGAPVVIAPASLRGWTVFCSCSAALSTFKGPLFHVHI